MFINTSVDLNINLEKISYLTNLHVHVHVLRIVFSENIKFSVFLYSSYSLYVNSLKP